MEQRFVKKIKIRPIPDEDWNVRAYWGVSLNFFKSCSIEKALNTSPVKFQVEIIIEPQKAKF